MMYVALYQYLLQYKKLPLPGIGTFSLERKPAVVDFPNKSIHPPSYGVALHFPAQTPSRQLFGWLAAALNISDRDAVRQFNDFAFDLKKMINNGDQVNWKGIGTLSKGLAGEVKFSPSSRELVLEQPVAAEKVIREKPEHMVRVGEDEKTAAEMVEMLSQPEEQKSYWWAGALALGLIAVIFIGWYFSEHGLEVGATANAKKTVPLEADSTYRILP